MPGTSLNCQLDSVSNSEVPQRSVAGAAIVVQSSLWPAGAAALHSSSGNVANANAVATFPAVAGKTNVVEAITITGAGATAALVVVATLTGLLGGTASFVITAPTGAMIGIQPLVVTFSPPIPASAPNTSIVLTLPALGVGNTNAAVTMHGMLL